MTPEIWNEAAWQPAFAKAVKRYEARVGTTPSPDAFQAFIYPCLVSIVALDLRRRFAGKLAYGAYVDDVLLEQCSHIPEAGNESQSDESKGLCNTFLVGVFQKPHTK